MRSAFKQCGCNVHFSPLNSVFSYERIVIGNDVYIGPNALFSSVCAITIGSKVTFGPGVTIMTGNHNFRDIGVYIFDNHSKREDDDLPVVIEDDVWVGCHAIILKGVTIGRRCHCWSWSCCDEKRTALCDCWRKSCQSYPVSIFRRRYAKHEKILGIQ